MYDLSVCLAAIRKRNWVRLYNSIVASVGNYSFELVFCGPHGELPEELRELDNVSCIVDFGSPTRAQQISMKNATGRYIAWTADDGWFSPGGLERCIKMLDEDPEEKSCIVTQYIEGGTDGLGADNPDLRGLKMYQINTHESARSPFYPDEYIIFNSVVIPTQYFKELGGFDCRFEVCAMAFVDFGARAQLDGIKTKLIGNIFECTQFPGPTGDHAPIHYGQLENDQPLYSQIWNSPSCLERIRIDYDNWKQAAEIWTRRFA